MDSKDRLTEDSSEAWQCPYCDSAFASVKTRAQHVLDEHDDVMGTLVREKVTRIAKEGE